MDRYQVIIIQSPKAFQLLFFRKRQDLPLLGDIVQCQEVLFMKKYAVGVVGATGMATGPHLHFEVRQDGEAQNPVAYFDSDIRDTLKME